MHLIRNILIVVFVVSFLTFVALFGQLPAFRRTPIGLLYDVLRHRIPNAIAKADHYVTGGRLVGGSQRVGHYLFYQKNPAVLIIFLALLTGSCVLFLRHAISLLPAMLIVPIPLLLVQPYLFTWLCVVHKGHYITPESHRDRLHDYPYDHVLFSPGNMCRTCELLKPARSKHCNFCGVCIAMCDHHCPWINNCVGRGNYRYFLALLLTLGAVELYGAYLSWYILRPHLKLNPAHAMFSIARFNNILDNFVIAVNTGGLSIAGVGLLTAATGFLPLGLLAYHCYLIWAGMTTNESQKWSDWREDMRDGLVLKANRRQLDKHYELQGHVDHASISISGGELNSEHSDRHRIEPSVPWPIRSNQVIIYSPDGQAPAAEEAFWTRIWNLHDVDNLYDLGGWSNLFEVLRGR